MKKDYLDKGDKNRPYLAVNAVIIKIVNKQKYILLGKRKNVPGDGYYYPPGGHVETGEKLSKTLIREVKEECGLDIVPGKLVYVEEAFKPNHHVILYYEAVLKDNNKEPINVEPNKCHGWQWFPMDNPPSPLWHTLKEGIITVKRIL